MGLVVSGIGAKRDGIAAGPSTDDLEGDIGVVAVNSDKKAHIDLVVPDGEIGMAGIDLFLRVDLRVFRSIVGHGNDLHRSRMSQTHDRLRHPDGVRG